MTNLLGEIADATRSEARAFLNSFQPKIELQVGRCANYSALLKGEFESVSPLRDLLEWAELRGRVIVCGRGASGKSVLLNRVAEIAADNGIAPFMIRLSQWDQRATDDWRNIYGNSREALDYLLRRFGSSDHDVSDAEFLSPFTRKFFLLDGLNETPGSTADQILAVCSDIVSIVVRAGVIVTDRLVRRSLASERNWYYVMPLPIDEGEVSRVLQGKIVPPASKSLLRLPFFLDSAIKGELQSSPLATIKMMVRGRGKLDDDELSAASEAAFRAYEKDGSRTFSLDRFGELGRLDVATKLLQGGILVHSPDERVAFFHHWYHDYLASKYVANRPTLWDFERRHRVFDALTFRANSFDAIAFALELLPSDASGSFLQAVYDWNPYAAGYALAEASIGPEDVPKEIRLIILAMLADKKFDRHFYSAQRGIDALDLFRDDDAVRLRSVEGLDDLLNVVSAMPPLSSRFIRWQSIFTLRGPQPPSGLVEALTDEDSIIGWTAANVVKRMRLSTHEFDRLRALASHSRPVVRWRVVHAMGAFPLDSFISELLNRVDHDKDENVRYGALRSLIEIASRGKEVLPHVVDEIIERLPSITSSPRLVGELSRAVFLSRNCAPSDWSEEILRVFYALLDRSDDALEAEQWSKVASRIRTYHRGEAHLPV